MKRILVSILALMTVGLTGCDNTVEMPNGQVPAQYLDKAKALEGTYKGKFLNHRGTLTVKFEGNKPVLTFDDGGANDLLDRRCHSRIGDLYAVRVGGKRNDPKLKTAYFSFDPGQCNIRGRTVNLDIKDLGGGHIRLDVAILGNQIPEQVCEYVPSPNPNVPPSQNCHLEWRDEWYAGRFSK